MKCHCHSWFKSVRAIFFVFERNGFLSVVKKRTKKRSTFRDSGRFVLNCVIFFSLSRCTANACNIFRFILSSLAMLCDGAEMRSEIFRLLACAFFPLLLPPVQRLKNTYFVASCLISRSFVLSLFDSTTLAVLAATVNGMFWAFLLVVSLPLRNPLFVSYFECCVFRTASNSGEIRDSLHFFPH